MPQVTISYYQSAIGDANFRTLQGARDARLGVEVLTADGAAQPAPAGSIFALIETDTNVRYTSTPESVEASGVATLRDGQPKVPGTTAACFPAAPFVMQGPISCEGGDVIRIAFG